MLNIKCFHFYNVNDLIYFSQVIDFSFDIIFVFIYNRDIFDSYHLLINAVWPVTCVI